MLVTAYRQNSQSHPGGRGEYLCNGQAIPSRGEGSAVMLLVYTLLLVYRQRITEC